MDIADIVPDVARLIEERYGLIGAILAHAFLISIVLGVISWGVERVYSTFKIPIRTLIALVPRKSKKSVQAQPLYAPLPPSPKHDKVLNPNPNAVSLKSTIRNHPKLSNTT